MLSTSAETELADPNNWSTDDEVHLLYCTIDNKPVGIDKHFQMSLIWKKFVSSSKKDVSSDTLWKKLNYWYNLKKLDDFEGMPIKLDDEDFQLPAEIIPDYVIKNLTEDEKKCVDQSGLHKKYISVTEPAEEEDFDKSQFRLKGSEKMKWFEQPVKAADKSKKSYENKPKESGDVVNEVVETKKVIRQYGKAGEVSSGSVLTLNVVPSIFDDIEEAPELKPVIKEEPVEKKTTTPAPASEGDKSSKTNRRKRNPEGASESEVEMSTPKPKVPKPSDSGASVTRSRKASSTSETPGEGDKNGSGEDKNPKRRFSQRVSSTSESKDTPVRAVESSKEAKRKSSSRR